MIRPLRVKPLDLSIPEASADPAPEGLKHLIRWQVIGAMRDQKIDRAKFALSLKAAYPKVRGLSKRKLYDFLDYGKSINSDALEAIFDLLGLQVVPIPRDR